MTRPRPKDLPSPLRVSELLSYDKASGRFTWLVHRSSTATVGSTAGKYFGPYIKIQVDGEWYFAHRLAFLMMAGSCPDQVDHRDGYSNRWSNLRAATSEQNTRNAKRRSDNASGVKNVYWDSQSSRWQVNIQADGVRRRKNFRSLEEAEDYALRFRVELHAEFARAA